MSETKIEQAIKSLVEPINKLNTNIENLNMNLKTSSETTSKLTKWLIFWTAIMALAVIGQILAIIFT